MKCRNCGSTDIDLEDAFTLVIKEPPAFIFTNMPDNGFKWGGGGFNLNLPIIEEDRIKIQTWYSSQPTCDHLASGNACCPCGSYLNEDVKAICVYVDGKQTWPSPYGKQGLSLEEAWKQLDRDYLDNKVHNLYCMGEPEKLKLMWDRQMITGKVYITRLREIGDKKQEACERMK